MVACVVLGWTADGKPETRSGSVPAKAARSRGARSPLDDEIAIDFPAVRPIVARICDGLAEEDARPGPP
jgi:hypothetical protein